MKLKSLLIKLKKWKLLEIMTDAAMNDQFGGSGFKQYGEAIASGY
jgi:hypothetical protein